MGLQGMMIVPDRTGHTETRWNQNNPAEVAVAEAIFDNMIEQGYSAFRLDADDRPGKRISEFDRTAEKIMFAPHLRGG